MSSAERYLKANQAGQAAEIATVQAVTGVHIDNYAVMNLAGFYTLAQDFGGIEVCVTPTTVNGTADANLYDTASGWNAVADGYNLKKGGSQYLHLAADQALAFVRDRDSLPDTDLSRTHRQQAVIDYVIWQLKHENAFSDLGQLTALLGDAKQWLITNSGFEPVRLRHQHERADRQEPEVLHAADLRLRRRRAQRLDAGRQQHRRQLHPAGREQGVQPARRPPPASGKSAAKKKAAPIPAASTVTVDVYNGGSTAGLAGSVSQALVSLGYKAGAVSDASAQSQTPVTGTEVFYGAGASANAAKIATDFGATAKALASLPAQHVEVLLGTG